MYDIWNTLKLFTFSSIYSFFHSVFFFSFFLSFFLYFFGRNNGLVSVTCCIQVILDAISFQELRGYMLKYGGRFENYFSRHCVTHIICSNLPDSKIKNLRFIFAIYKEFSCQTDLLVFLFLMKDCFSLI